MKTLLKVIVGFIIIGNLAPYIKNNFKIIALVGCSLLFLVYIYGCYRIWKIKHECTPLLGNIELLIDKFIQYDEEDKCNFISAFCDKLSNDTLDDITLADAIHLAKTGSENSKDSNPVMIEKSILDTRIKNVWKEKDENKDALYFIKKLKKSGYVVSETKIKVENGSQKDDVLLIITRAMSHGGGAICLDTTNAINLD